MSKDLKYNKKSNNNSLSQYTKSICSYYQLRKRYYAGMEGWKEIKYGL